MFCMDINDFLPKRNMGGMIQKDTDPVKYDAIASKLCDKRQTLEQELAHPDIDPTKRDDIAMELLQIKQDLAMFGITEIDYVAYIASKEKLDSK